MRDARVVTATSFAGSRHSRRKEQATSHASSQIAARRSQTPSVTEVISTGISTVAPPPVTSLDGVGPIDVKAIVQDIVKSYLTQLGVILQDIATQSQVQSLNEDPEPAQIEDISSGGEISDSDQEDPRSRTLLNQLLIPAEEQADYD